jgi:hypothetical protein
MHNLPSELAYVAAAASDWQHFSLHVEDPTFPWKLSAHDADRLLKVYERMATLGHELALSKWLFANPTHPSHTPLRDFLKLFQVLYSRKILDAHPWGLGFRYHEFLPLDWSKLPADLEFLRDPAELYGDYFFEGDFHLLAWRLGESDKAWIRNRLISTWSVDLQLKAFFHQYPPEDHPESRLIAQFIDLCFQLDIGELPPKPD